MRTAVILDKRKQAFDKSSKMWYNIFQEKFFRRFFMFGYVKPFKPQMRMCEFETYKAVYCGLCKTLGRSYGFPAKMTLSYDLTFLGLLSLSLNDVPAEIINIRCAAHPLRKTPCLKTEHGLDYTAAAASILVYHKIRDDISDRRFLGKIPPLFMLGPIKGAYKKASAAYPELAEFVSEQMERQAQLEKDNCKSIDRAAEPFSGILGEIAAGITDDEEKKRILRRFGYLLGRYIYITDAFDDVENDFRTDGFNPLILGNRAVNDLDMQEIIKKASDSINFTLGALADCYVELDIKRFRPIIDNIVYLGLKNVFYDIIKKKENKERSE